jgi:hypothetical protein
MAQDQKIHSSKLPHPWGSALGVTTAPWDPESRVQPSARSHGS